MIFYNLVSFTLTLFAMIAMLSAKRTGVFSAAFIASALSAMMFELQKSFRFLYFLRHQSGGKLYDLRNSPPYPSLSSDFITASSVSDWSVIATTVKARSACCLPLPLFLALFSTPHSGDLHLHPYLRAFRQNKTGVTLVFWMRRPNLPEHLRRNLRSLEQARSFTWTGRGTLSMRPRNPRLVKSCNRSSDWKNAMTIMPIRNISTKSCTICSSVTTTCRLPLFLILRPQQ